MPFDWDDYLEELDVEQLYESRGELVYERMTPGVRQWLRVLDEADVPGPGSRVVVTFCGRKIDDPEDLGVCLSTKVLGERFAERVQAGSCPPRPEHKRSEEVVPSVALH